MTVRAPVSGWTIYVPLSTSRTAMSPDSVAEISWRRRFPAATTSGTVTCSSLGVAARSKWNALVIA
ncbi:Uncharacterised protein [Mycobacterium tuberculosis]|uniref:Uncharacterized protein n=1 Tax=Mycobacterium tuberculosis TaxID=1773 RepID=A0A916PD75_MYCTX|nr:Uncharacterised protein [Mycobacterium tuberculosis]